MILRKDLREVKKFGGKIAVRLDLQPQRAEAHCMSPTPLPGSRTGHGGRGGRDRGHLGTRAQKI